MNSDGSTTVRENGFIIQMILIWINKLLEQASYNGLKELSDGVVFEKLTKLIIQNFNDENRKAIRISEIRESYELVRMIFENNFKISEGINYALAKMGDEFELAKISFIILMNGIFNEVRAIIDASDSLDTQHHEIVTDFIFYKKINRPIPIEIYVEYLTKSDEKLRSTTKTSSVHRTPPKLQKIIKLNESLKVVEAENKKMELDNSGFLEKLLGIPNKKDNWDDSEEEEEIVQKRTNVSTASKKTTASSTSGFLEKLLGISNKKDNWDDSSIQFQG